MHADRLRRATDVEFARARREGRREGTDAYAADALLAMLAAGGTLPVGKTPPTPAETPKTPDDTPARPRRLDQLIGAADDTQLPLDVDHSPSEHPTEVPAGTPRLLPPGAKAEVVVLVDGIALQRGHVGVGERCEIVGVGPVELDWVNQLLPEAIVHALVHDGVDISTYAPIRKRVGRVRSAKKRVAPGR